MNLAIGLQLNMLTIPSILCKSGLIQNMHLLIPDITNVYFCLIYLFPLCTTTQTKSGITSLCTSHLEKVFNKYNVVMSICTI